MACRCAGTRPDRPGRASRRGAVLIYLVLGLATALGALALAVSWNAGSGYALSSIDATRIGTEAAQSSLAEAAALAFEGSVTEAAPEDLRRLRDQLFDALERAIDPGGNSIPAEGVAVSMDLPPDRLPALRLPSGDVTVERLTFRLHGFRPMPYGEGAAFAAKEVYYQEKAFRDESKDHQPHDFAGFLTVELEVASRERGRTVRRRHRSTRDAKVVDVTPPAREFGVFSYGIPPDAGYMLNDLNSGGRLTIYSRGSRAFVRGPLFLKVEDASDPVHLGGDARKTPSVSYPERGRDWHGWAFIPGPRAVHMSNFTGHAGELLGQLGGLLGARGPSTHPRRPDRTEDRVEAKLFGFSLPGTVLIGPALNPGIGAFFPIPADEQIACAQPWVYLTGTLPPGKQTFSLSGDPDPAAGSGVDGTHVAMYDGLLSKKGGEVKGLYRDQLRFPHQRYAGGKEVADGDAVMAEPFGYERTSQTGSERPLDHGIYGVYKVVDFKRDLAFQLKLLDFLGAFWPPAKTLVVGSEHLLRKLGITPDLWILLVNWSTRAPPDLDARLEPELLTEGLEKQQYFIAPYGLYYESPHNREVMMEVATLAMAAGVSYSAFTLQTTIFKAFFEKHKAAADKVGERAVKVIKEKRFGAKFPTAAERAGKLTHGVVHWFSEAWVGETFKVVIKAMLKIVMNGAIENVAFLSTWKAVDYFRKRHLRASLGKIAHWEPAPSNADLAREFPKGLYPSKYRPYARVASRLHATFDDLLARHTAADGVLELDDVVMVKSLSYRSATPLKYRGRGVIVALGGAGEKGPSLDVPVVRADPASYLTLVVEDLGDEAPGRPTERSVELGPVFQGTVYATSGVRPAGESTVLLGNLVTLHMNKSKIPMTSRLDVVYDGDRLSPEADARGRKDWWRLSVSPRSAGLDE